MRKCWDIAANVVGGSLSLMSGGLSIPFALAALYCEGRQRLLFAICAFTSLLFFAVRAIMKNYQLQHSYAADLEKGLRSSNEQIAVLHERLNAKSEADKLVIQRQFAKEQIGNLIIALNNRLFEAKQVNSYQFEGDVSTTEWETTSNLLKTIADFLAEYLTQTDSALFKVARPAQLPEQWTADGLFGEKRRDWQWHYNTINCKLDELKKIAERLN